MDDENDVLSLLKKTLVEKKEADQKLRQKAGNIDVEAAESEESDGEINEITEIKGRSN